MLQSKTKLINTGSVALKKLFCLCRLVWFSISFFSNMYHSLISVQAGGKYNTHHFWNKTYLYINIWHYYHSSYLKLVWYTIYSWTFTEHQQPLHFICIFLAVLSKLDDQHIFIYKVCYKGIDYLILKDIVSLLYWCVQKMNNG